jgi:LysR family hydrogen peroxide-inducible transcriptional activator
LTTHATYVLPPVLADLVQRYPRLRIDVSPGLLAAHVERLARGELDAIVSVGDVPDAGLATRTIGEVRAMAALPAAMAQRRPISVRALREHPFVAYGRVGDSFFDRVWSFVEREGLSNATRISAPHIDTIKSLVAAGAGLSILPDYTIVEPALAARPVEGLDLVQPVWIGFRPSAVEVPILGELTETLRARWPARRGRARP